LKKNDVLITISNIGSSKSYNLSQFLQRSLITVASIVVAILLISFYFIKFLDNEVNTLKYASTQLTQQKIKYEKIIKDKKDKIDALDGALEQIEHMIGIKGEEDTTLIQRATIAQLTTAEKMYMLEVIPNGKPLNKITTQSRFGWRIHPVTKERKFHRGIDLRAKRGSPVYATADGVVKHVQSRNKGAYGKMIIISHNFGFETAFAHLEKPLVRIGDIVYKGQLIGRSGNTGRSTGPHLHYEVRYANKVLQPKDFILWDLQHYKFILKKQRRIRWESLIKQIKKQSSKLAQL
jgi:hypothetical protein